VRELRNFIYRLALLAREDSVDAASVAALLDGTARGEEQGGEGIDGAIVQWLANTRPPAGSVYDEALAAFERPLLRAALRETGGNQLRAAQYLGINRNTLRKRLSDLGIDPTGE
jgi:two-component system nitrogen regulation response regulator GlnG